MVTASPNHSRITNPFSRVVDSIEVTKNDPWGIKVHTKLTNIFLESLPASLIIMAIDGGEKSIRMANNTQVEVNQLISYEKSVDSNSKRVPKSPDPTVWSQVGVMFLFPAIHKSRFQIAISNIPNFGF